MKIFEAITKYGHEQIVLCHDEATNLRAVIAIHNTILGPALGGCRMWPFESEEEAIFEKLNDVLFVESTCVKSLEYGNHGTISGDTLFGRGCQVKLGTAHGDTFAAGFIGNGRRQIFHRTPGKHRLSRKTNAGSVVVVHIG